MADQLAEVNFTEEISQAEALLGEVALCKFDVAPAPHAPISIFDMKSLRALDAREAEREAKAQARGLESVERLSERIEILAGQLRTRLHPLPGTIRPPLDGVIQRLLSAASAWSRAWRSSVRGLAEELGPQRAFEDVLKLEFRNGRWRRPEAMLAPLREVLSELRCVAGLAALPCNEEQAERRALKVMFSLVGLEVEGDGGANPSSKVRLFGRLEHVASVEQLLNLQRLAVGEMLEFKGANERKKCERLEIVLAKVLPNGCFVRIESQVATAGRPSKLFSLSLAPEISLELCPYESSKERAERNFRMVREMRFAPRR